MIACLSALKILANKAGVELKKENPKLKTERQRLYEICDLSCSFFEKQLGNSLWGKEAKEYLLKRGIKEESIKKWRIGYSPDTWQGLSDFLVGRGYKREEIVKAGLAVESQKSQNPYDRFRGRIIFPIFNLNSQVVGFGGRVFSARGGSAPGGKDVSKEIAKYINTPQTLLYDKSSILYGMNNAKMAVRKNNQCVLTEGYTDVIMSQQAGFENTVASSGTALTWQHLNLLKRYSDNLLLAFDMDVAGDSATKRGINLAETQGFNIKVIDAYSKTKDPAEIIFENPKNWQDALSKARSIMDYYFDSAFTGFDAKTPGGKKEISKIILPAIKRLPNRIEQSHWVQKLSQKLDTREDAILEELKKVKSNDLYLTRDATKEKALEVDNKNLTAEGRKKLLEDKIMSLILKDPESLNLIEQPHHNLFCEKTQKFIENIKKITPLENGEPKVAFADAFKIDGYKDFLDTLSLRAEVEYEEDGCEEIQLCLAQLKDINIRDRRAKISQEIKKAELEKNFEKVGHLIKEFNLIN